MSPRMKLAFLKGSLFSLIFMKVQCMMTIASRSKQTTKCIYRKINKRETQRNHTNTEFMSREPKANENQWVFISKALEICQIKIGIQWAALLPVNHWDTSCCRETE